MDQSKRRGIRAINEGEEATNQNRRIKPKRSEKHYKIRLYFSYAAIIIIIAILGGLEFFHIKDRQASKSDIVNLENANLLLENQVTNLRQELQELIQFKGLINGLTEEMIAQFIHFEGTDLSEKEKKGKVKVIPIEYARVQARHIKEACEPYPDIDPALLLALMYVESMYDPAAVSNKNAVGLTQIIEKYWVKELIEKGIINSAEELHTSIEKSIKAGAYILNKCIQMYKNNKDPNKRKYWMYYALWYYNGRGNEYPNSVRLALGRIATFLIQERSF